MATLRRTPKGVSGLLLAGLISVIGMVVAPSFATSATATARASALGTHDRAEVIAGTAGQVFKVEVAYPPEPIELPEPPAVQANAAIATPPNVPLPGGSLLPNPILELPIPPDTSGLNAGPPANFVQITVPTNLITLQSGPEYMTGAWTCRNFPSTSRVVCRGGVLLPGTSDSFVVIGNVNRPAVDTTGTWSVSTSDDNGSTLIPSAPAAAGAMDTTARILQVHNVEITAPAGATDHIVTAGQDNIEVRCDVTNSGSAPLDVTPTLSGVVGSTGPAFQTVAENGGTASFTFTGVTVGPEELGTLLCGASAAGATGVAGTRAFAAHSKVAIGAMGGEDLSPNDVVQGASYGLSLFAVKSGMVSVDSGLTGTLTFDDGTTFFSAPLESPTSLPAGDAGVTLQFGMTMIDPLFDNGAWQLALSLSGIDSNGAVVSLTPTVPQIVVNDALPVIDPLLTPPMSRVPSQPDAIFDGGTLSFDGEVRRGGVNCSSCTLLSARLLQFDVKSGPLPDIDLDGILTYTASSGDIGGTYTGDYDPAATATQLELTVQDNALRATSINRSPLIDVDNIAPTFIRAVTGGPSNTDLRRIDVWLSEDLGGKTFGLTDFLMSGNVVTHAFREGRRVTLELLLPLGEDERPQLFFGTLCVDPAFVNTPLCTELYDRVGHPVASGALVAFDGINPLAPILKAVDGDRGDKNDEGVRRFYSNDSQTLFTVGRVTIGHTLTLVLDDGTDTVIVDKQIALADCTGDPDARGRCIVEVESSPIVAEGPMDVVAFATDALQTGDWDLSTPAVEAAPRNTGPSVTETVVFDFTKPVIIDADWDGASTLDVSLSEDVLGRDFGADWLALATDGGPVQTFQIRTVIGSEDKRTLTIDDDAFGAGWTVVGVVYEYVGATPSPVALPPELSKAGRILRAINGPDEQYHDRGTNLLDSGTPFSCGGSCA